MDRWATERTSQGRSATWGAGREARFELADRSTIFLDEIRELPLEDIPLLVWTFVGEFNQKMGKAVDQISRATLEELSCHAWPGNVRELRNLVERAMIMTEARSLAVAGTPSKNGDRANGAVLTLEEVEERHILKAGPHPG